jgi:hypothetical protein
MAILKPLEPLKAILRCLDGRSSTDHTIGIDMDDNPFINGK